MVVGQMVLGLLLLAVSGCGRIGFVEGMTADGPGADAQDVADRCERGRPGLPIMTGRAWYVSPSGSDVTGNGSTAAPFASLAGVGSLPQPGDRVVTRSGTYGQQIVEFDGAPGEP